VKPIAKLCGSVGFLVIVAASPIWAADMPLKAPLPAPPPVYSWTGCYIGANVGGAWARSDYIDPLAVPPDNLLGSHRAGGVVGGGQIGCDYQAGAWVFGVQGLYDAADLRATHLAIDDFLRTKINSIAMVTARLGYAVQPNLLAYVKGGGAWIRDDETKTDLVTGLVEGTARVTRSGYTVGGGLEFLFAPGWSVFGEFDYLNFGRHNVNFTNLEIPPVPPVFPLSIKTDALMATAGLNYRFNWPR
jgi:outer membrane immunogenic protein